MSELQIDTGLLAEFERGLDPQHPEESRIPARVLGYGEISTVFEIQAEGLRGLAFKRLPLFNSTQEVVRYQAVYDEYNRILEQDIGLCIPPHGSATFLDPHGRPVFYIIQQQLPPDSIGNRALHRLPAENTFALVRQVLGELHKVWDYDRRQDRVQVGLDGQISNWCPREGGEGGLWYVDTSTPLYRVQGVEQLDTELFLRSAPSFLVWVLRLFFLSDVVNRYYDFHLVMVDLAANFYKEQRPDLIPGVVETINAFVRELPDWKVELVTEKEVSEYYREDALIWSLYLNMRKLDRFLRTRLLRRGYPYILPSKIRR